MNWNTVIMSIAGLSRHLELMLFLAMRSEFGSIVIGDRNGFRKLDSLPLLILPLNFAYCFIILRITVVAARQTGRTVLCPMISP